MRRAIEQKGAEALGCRHDRHAHPRHDSEARLREQPIQRRAHAPGAQRSRPGLVESSKSGLDTFTSRQHDLEGTGVAAMVTHWCVAKSPFERISDDAASGTRAGRVHPESGTARLQELVELLLGDTGLDRDVCEFFVEIDDTVQSAEIEERTVAN